MLPVFVDGSFPHDSVAHPVDHSIVGIGFQEEWRPVELDRRIIILIKIREEELRKVRSTDMKTDFESYLCGENLEGAFCLHRLGVVVWDGGVEKTDQGSELASVQGVADEHHPLPPESFQHERGVEAGQVAAVRLPPPVLVLLVGPPVLLAGQLRLDVRALRFVVMRSALLVSQPPAVEYIALSLHSPYRKWQLLNAAVAFYCLQNRGMNL